MRCRDLGLTLLAVVLLPRGTFAQAAEPSPAAVAVAVDAGESAPDAGLPEATPAAGEPESPAPDAGSSAAPASDGMPVDIVEQLSALEDELNEMVVSTTKTRLRAEQAPSVMTVVTAEEIQARGLRSIADVLRTVPGFYDVYDLAFHNVGVRGISGGARAAGNVVLVMIDGTPVNDRSTNGNFLGEELIPIEVVERVEIVRGPVSAVYGANAYFGLINVITKSGEALSGVRLVAQGGLEREHPGGGGAIVAGGAGESFSVVAAAQALYSDRSGLALPASSPRLGDANSPLPARGTSQNDVARPISFFAKASLQKVLKGSLDFMASVQNLDAGGEFQDFGPLTHGTRLQLLNQTYRLGWRLPIGEKASASASLAYFNVGPLAGDRRDIGRSDYLLLRSSGTQGVSAGVEGQAQPWEPLGLLLGADFRWEDNLLPTYDRLYERDLLAPDGTVLLPSGTIVPGTAHGAHAIFRNWGVYAQALATLGKDFHAVLGGRVDAHNVTGAYPTGRLGVVWAPPNGALSLKAMVGTSYRAPSAEQLYTQPMAVLDARGNPALKPQKAETFELAFAWRLPDNLGELTANVYLASVRDRVEFMQTGLYLQAQNVQDEWVLGGELYARFNLAKSFQLRLSGTVARTVSKTTGQQDLEGMPQVTNPLFPPYQVHLIGVWQLPWGGLKICPEVSYVGPRSASQSNALEQGTAYTVPDYFYTALAVSAPPRRLLGDTETGFALRLTNLFDQRRAEPGFGGIDVPAAGFTAMLVITQSL